MESPKIKLIGPVLLLKTKGTICPCLEKEDEQMARQAAFGLNNVPIIWNESSHLIRGSAISAAGKFVSSLFGGDSGNGSNNIEHTYEVTYDHIDTSRGKKRQEKKLPRKKRMGTHCMLSIVDTNYGPSIWVREEFNPNDNTNAIMDTFQDEDQIGDSKSPNQKLVTLSSISEATPATDAYFDTAPNQSGIVLRKWKGLSTNTHKDGVGGEITGKKEDIFQFNIRLADDCTKHASSKQRDDILDKILILVEWDKKIRMENNYCEDENQGDLSRETGTTNSLTEKANKIKLFAKREIEMQKKKKEREERKARYVKAAGGLKYTALAMANRTEVS
mmetsp:Transcript_22928/g.32311  ORF Transcript_22928/g.32311 Transcript_22928/m.32311 type:complete len:332 (+) Transcript_22928:278-1273(+)|eukprot:CAMPEP_0184858764 /NCGR_PEP_ID=MMETSP0580-20130426/3823_1 /TAXON_ID=1118495 /ORGANISM="Dactyliosolen fragilissimus" /LENGTH=331 /DNA_ID=CAMNT_0027355067 /DNA_START=164 /DNA_END=1159 /DNA_ORIENTATION=+